MAKDNENQEKAQVGADETVTVPAPTALTRADDANTTPVLRESLKDAPMTTEGVEESGQYVVLDAVMYLTQLDEKNEKVVRVAKFHRGQKVTLSAPLARTLTMEPRPSVRPVGEED